MGMSVEANKVQELTSISKDRIDLKRNADFNSKFDADLFPTAIALFAIALPFGLAHLFPELQPILEPFAQISRAGFSVGLLKLASHGVLYAYYGVNAWNLGLRTIYEDKNLGYVSEQLVYQGKKPFPVGKERLIKGDNFLLVNLPDCPSPAHESQALQWYELSSDLSALALGEVKRHFGGVNYRAVFVSLGSTVTEGIIARNDHYNLRGLVAGKGLSQTSLNWGLLLTRDEFEDLDLNPKKRLSEVAEALGDRRVLDTVELMTKTAAERENLKRDLIRYLDRKLVTRVAAYHDGSFVRTRDSQNDYFPGKERVLSEIRVQRVGQNLRGERVFYKTGERASLGIEDLVESTPDSLEEVLKDKSPWQKLRLIVLFERILETTPLEQLFRERITDPNLLLKAINEAHLEIRGRQRLSFKFNGWSSFKAIATRWTQAIVLAGLIGGVGLAESSLAGRGLSFMGYGFNTNSESIVEQRGTFSANFPDRVPAHGLDWRVEANESKESGYYTTSTSHILGTNLVWEEEMTREEEIHLPFELGKERPYIKLEKRLTLPTFGEVSIKIPVRDRSTLSALDVTDQDGKRVNFQIYKLVDGTFELVIKNNQPFSSSWADVSAYLGESFSDGPRATKKIDKLNEQELSQEVRDIVDIAYKSSPSPYFDVGLSNAISSSHIYSLTSSDGESFAASESREERVNTIQHSPNCDCGVCNTEDVLLLSTFDPNPNNTVNMAAGYLHEVQTPGADVRGEFLLAETRHAYGLDQTGFVLDATPRTLANDEKTGAYLRMFESGNDGTLNFEDEWRENLRTTAQRGEQNSLLVKSLALIGGSLSLGLGLFLGDKVLRLPRLPKMRGIDFKARKREETWFLSTLTKEDLVGVFNTLSRVSWAGNMERSGSLTLDGMSKQQILEKLAGEIHYGRVSDYLKAGRRSDGQAKKVFRYLQKFAN